MNVEGVLLINNVVVVDSYNNVTSLRKGLNFTWPRDGVTTVHLEPRETGNKKPHQTFSRRDSVVTHAG